jgi:hypothetical protein
MKKILNLSLSLAAGIFLTACAATSQTSPTYSKLDVKTECNVKANGIEKVLATAKEYNAIAKQKGLEFRRLEVNNSNLIDAVEEGIKSNAKEVNPKTFKGKKSKTKLPIDFAAERACKFAISALTQAEEAKSTWRMAIPGDGYKY